MFDPVTIAGAAGLAALIEPIVDAAVGKAKELATNVAGGILHEKYHEIERHIRDRIPGFIGFPANHDVRRAVRLAQLQALDYVLNDYGRSNPPEWKDDPVNKPKWFLDKARAFVRTQLPLRGEVKVDGTEAQARAIDASVEAIIAALASSLSPGGRDAVRGLAEDTVLAELRLELKGIVLPEDCESRFRGKSPPAVGWFSAFTRYLAEQVKENERFRNILVTDLLADLTQLGLATQDIVRALDVTVKSIEMKVDAMEEANERRHRQLHDTTLRIETTTNKTDGAIQRIEARLDQVIPMKTRGGRASSKPDQAKGLHIVEKRDVMEWGWKRPMKQLGKVLLSLDKKWIREGGAGAEFSGENNSGTARQWALIFDERPYHWRLLVDEHNVIVGYWEMHLLYPESYEELKAGKLDEDRLTVRMMPVAQLGSGKYSAFPAYFSMIGLDEKYRGTAELKVLLDSLFDVLYDLAHDYDMFVSEITARAWTDAGATMCRHIGMKPHMKADESPNIKVDHWCGSIDDIINHIPKTYKKLKALRKLYAEREVVRIGESAAVPRPEA